MPGTVGATDVVVTICDVVITVEMVVVTMGSVVVGTVGMVVGFTVGVVVSGRDDARTGAGHTEKRQVATCSTSGTREQTIILNTHPGVVLY